MNPDGVTRQVVARFAFHHEALLACQMLQEEGFDSAVLGSPLFGLGNAGLPSANTAFEVTVPAPEAQSALELLERIDLEYRPEIPHSVTQEEVSAPCPKCGASDKAYEALNRRNRWARSGLWSEDGRPDPTYTWRCVGCDHRW